MIQYIIHNKWKYIVNT